MFAHGDSETQPLQPPPATTAATAATVGTPDALPADMRTMLLGLGLLTGFAACQSATEPPMPWLRGLGHTIASDRPTASTMRRLSDLRDASPECELAAHEGIELVADVSPRPGVETVVASYAQGILVFDREDRLVASTPGYPCSGTADSIEILAAGSAWGMPTLVIVGSTGRRNERDTWTSLMRVTSDRIEASFTGIIEEKRGDEILRGSLLVLPRALLYRRPGGAPTLYLYDPVPGVYMPPLEEMDHSEDDGPLGPVSLR